jgi:hypothetical protein
MIGAPDEVAAVWGAAGRVDQGGVLRPLGRRPGHVGAAGLGKGGTGRPGDSDDGAACSPRGAVLVTRNEWTVEPGRSQPMWQTS